MVTICNPKKLIIDMDLEGESKACIYFKTNKYIILQEQILKP